MARLRDFPAVVRKVGLWTFTKRIYNELDQDHLLTLAAAVAYAWLFAVFPFFIFLLTLVPYLPEDLKATAATEIEYNLRKYMPDETSADAIWSNVRDVLGRPRQGLLGMGILVTLWVASGGMAMTMTAVERCYEIDQDPPFWRQRPIAIMLTIIVAALVLAVIALLPVGTAVVRELSKWELDLTPLVRVSRWLAVAALGLPLIFILVRLRNRIRLLSIGMLLIAGLIFIVILMAAFPVEQFWRDYLLTRHKIPQWLLRILNISRWSLALVFLFMTVEFIYYFGPRIKKKFRAFSPGSVFVIGVWLLLGVLFKVYLGKFSAGSYNQTYGTVAGVAILLMMFYFDAAVLLVGAEINAEIDFEILGVPRGARVFEENRHEAEGQGTPNAEAHP